MFVGYKMLAPQKLLNFNLSYFVLNPCKFISAVRYISYTRTDEVDSWICLISTFHPISFKLIKTKNRKWKASNFLLYLSMIWWCLDKKVYHETWSLHCQNEWGEGGWVLGLWEETMTMMMIGTANDNSLSFIYEQQSTQNQRHYQFNQNYDVRFIPGVFPSSFICA